MELKKQRITAIAGMILLAVITAFVFIIWKNKIMVFLSEPEILRNWVEEKGFVAQIVFILITILQILIAVIPGEPFEVAAGYAFGAFEGTILCLIASGLGSFIVFYFVRKFGIKLVKLFFSEEKINSLNFLKISKKKTIIYFIIYIIPGTPKDLLCYFAGLTDIKLPLWFIISTVGRIPSIISSTVGGNLLGTENYLSAIAVFLVTMGVCIMGILIFYRITETNKGEMKNDN